jgi:hypothetical protein
MMSWGPEAGVPLPKRRIIVHAGQPLAHLGQHAVVADPAIEAVQLKIDADVRVQVVIADWKRERRGSRHGIHFSRSPYLL